MKKQARQQQQKRLMRYQWKTVKSEDTSRREETHPKQKQRLKEVSKCINNVSVTTNEKTARHLEDFKGVNYIPGIKPAKKKVLIAKIKNEKGEIITSRKGIANVFGDFRQKNYDDNVQDETEQEIGENENESSIDVHNNNTNERMRIPENMTEELRELQSTNSKKANPQTATESKQKTPKHATMRREKWWDTSSTKS